MAMINLLPNKLRRPRTGKKREIKSFFPQVTIPKITLPKISLSKISLVLPILIIILFLIGVLLVVSIQVKNKTNILSSLNQKIQKLKSEYQIVDELNKRKKELTELISFYESVFKNRSSWSEKLYLINKLIPAQIWLMSITTESKITKTLTIKGSATSLLEADIIASITQFVSKLKENSVFSNDFKEIKLGPLHSGRKGNFTLMNFTLYCKFK